MKIHHFKIMKINVLSILFIIVMLLVFFDQNTIAFVFVGISIVIHLLVTQNGYGIALKNMKYLVLCFVVISASTLISGIVLEDMISRFMQVLLYFLIILYPIFLLRRYGEEYVFNGIELIANIICLTSAFGVIEGVLKKNILIHLFRPDIGTFTDGLQQYRVCSLYLQPVICAHIFLFSFLFFMEKENKNWADYIKIIILLFAILMTKSRSSWITIVICVFVNLFKHLNGLYVKNFFFTKKLIYFILFLAILVFMANKFEVLNLIVERFKEFTTTSTRSITQRTGIVDLIWRELSDSNIFSLLFGHGHEATYYLLKNNTIYIKDFTTTDNEWLSLLFNYGIILLIIMVIIFLKAIKNYLTCNDSKHKTIYMLLIGGFVNMIFWESLSNVLARFLTFIVLGATIYLFLKLKNMNNRKICEVKENEYR